MPMYRIIERGEYTKVYQVVAPSKTAALKEYEKNSKHVIELMNRTHIKEIAVLGIDSFDSYMEKLEEKKWKIR
jgi:hypothetical protein